MYKMFSASSSLRSGVVAACLIMASVEADSYTVTCKKDTIGNYKSAPKISALPAAMKPKIFPLTTDSGYDISRSLPIGFVKDGSIDYTFYLQQALVQHDHVVFPPFPIQVNDNGLSIGSNKTITFLAGSKLILRPSGKKSYNILKIDGASNVTLNNPVIIGDRLKHIGTDGEWGMGIGVYSSNNVTINNPVVSYCWGDGIYVGSGKGSTGVNHNVKILNAKLLHNRRNGISVISADQLLLSSPYAAYSDGTEPMCGIDIEPNSPDNELRNITVLNAVTEFNPGAGISIGLRSMYGRNSKAIDIQLIAPKDNGSGIGLKATATLTHRLGSEIINGNINVVNPIWSRNSDTPMSVNILDENIRLIIKKPAIRDAAGRQLSNKAALDNLTYKTHLNRNANYQITF